MENINQKPRFKKEVAHKHGKNCPAYGKVCKFCKKQLFQ